MDVSIKKFAFISLLQDEFYISSAIVLAKSIREVKSKAETILLMTSEISNQAKTKLQKVFDKVFYTQELIENENSALLVSVPILAAWKLTTYEKCVFLNYNTLVIENIDSLFDAKELSAVPNMFWPEIFNLDVFVMRPSEETTAELQKLATGMEEAEKVLLQYFLQVWQKDAVYHLSPVYNFLLDAKLQDVSEYKENYLKAKIVNFQTQNPTLLSNFNLENYPILNHFLKMWKKFDSQGEEDSVWNVLDSRSTITTEYLLNCEGKKRWVSENELPDIVTDNFHKTIGSSPQNLGIFEKNLLIQMKDLNLKMDQMILQLPTTAQVMEDAERSEKMMDDVFEKMQNAYLKLKEVFGDEATLIKRRRH